MSGSREFPTQTALKGKKGGQWWAGYCHSCAIQIEYERDWDDDCPVALAQTLKAATVTYKQCATGGGVIKGVRQLKADGKCDAKLRVTGTNERQPPQRQAPQR